MKKDKPMNKAAFKFMVRHFKNRDKKYPPHLKIEKTKIKKGDIILDYGCGPGGFTIAAAELVGSSGKVYAADIHPLAIKKIRKSASKKGLKNIETILTDCDTNIESQSVDVVICFDLIHGLVDLEVILKEFHRVLKPKSVLSIDDHHLKEEEIIPIITKQDLFKFKDKNETVYLFSKIEK